MLMPLTFNSANGGGGTKKTSDEHDPPFLNRLKGVNRKALVTVPIMTGLQDGENRTSLAPNRYSIWWPQTGSSKYNL